MFGLLGTVWAEAGLDTRKLDMGVMKASASLKALGRENEALARTAKTAAAGIALIGGALVVGAVKLATDFESAMHRAWSVTDATRQQMQAWSQDVLKLSKTLPTSAKDLAEALYWVKSDMPDATDAEQMKTLEIAARGAVGGVAELSDATEALITVQNAYNDMDPAKYMDLMNWAVQRGSITLQDFVANMGKATGTAAQANVPFQDLAAAVATLTRKGIPADTAFMALNQTMMAFLKNTDEAAQTAQKYGIDMSLASLRSKGLAGALMEISEKVPDEELAQLFPNVRALKAVFPLAGTAAAEFARDLSLAGEAAGTTAGMYEKIMEDPAKKFSLAINKMKTSLTSFGVDLMPTISKALDQLIRILEGKNEVFNAFGAVLQSAAGFTWDLVGALRELWPLLLGIGAAVAAVKMTNFVSAIASAATGLPALNNVIANLQLGFTRGMASVGGLATSLGTIGLLAAPAALGIGYLITKIRDADRAGEEAWNTIRKNDKAMTDLGIQILPMASRYTVLRAELERQKAAGEDYSATQAEMVALGNQLADAAPLLAAGIDEQGNAIIRSNEALDDYIGNLLAFSKISLTTTGDTAQLEALIQKNKQLRTAYTEMSSAITEIGDAMMQMGVTELDAGQAMQLLSTDFDAGQASVGAFLQQIRDQGGPAWDLTALLSNLDSLYKQWGFTLAGVRGQLDQNAIAIANIKVNLMKAAFESGAAAGLLTDNIITALSSSIPEFRQFGLDAGAQTVAGMLAMRGVTGETATQLSQEIINKLASGDYSSTGSKAGDEVMNALIAQIAGKKGEIEAATKGAAGDGGKMGKVWSKALAQSMKDSKGEIQKAAKSATDVKIPDKKLKVKPTLDPATLTLTVKKKYEDNPTFTNARDSAKYVIGAFQGYFDSNQLTLGVDKVYGGAGGISSAVGDLDKAWTALNQTALVWWSQSVDNVKWGQIEQAIVNLAPDPGVLDSWRRMTGVLAAAQTQLKSYSKEIDAHEVKLNSLTHQQELLNRSLTTHQEKLSKLSQMKMVGETAASDESFRLQHEINKLELAMLDAKDRRAFKEYAELARQKKLLENEKARHDLEATVDYEQQRHDLEKLLDPLKGQEMAYEDIVKGITKEQAEISKVETQLAKVEKQINKERDAVWTLKVKYDEASKAVQEYQSYVDQMAQNFLSHYQEMLRAQEELNRSMAGGGAVGGGAYMGAVSGGSMAASSVTNSNSISYFFFDKLVLEGVQDIGGLEKELMNAKLRMAVPR